VAAPAEEKNFMAEMTGKAKIDYTNHRGERRERVIGPPARVWLGRSPWHGDSVQWFLHAVDVEKGEERDFALKDIHGWSPVNE
jgi:hypothetical protein